MFDITNAKPTPSQIRDRIAEAVRERVPGVNTDRDALLGQLLDVVADEAALAYDYAEAAFLASNPVTATGMALRAHALSRNVTPVAATEPSYMALVSGTPPESFLHNGATIRVLSRSEGRYGYARDSIRYGGVYNAEWNMLQATQTRVIGGAIIGLRTTASSYQSLPAIGAEDLSIAWLDTRFDEMASFEWGRAFPTGIMSSGSAGETDDALRARVIEASRTQVGGTVDGIESAMRNAGFPATVTANWGQQPLLSGQPPQTVHIGLFSVPQQSRIPELAAAIRRARPAGIPSWGREVDLATGEMWGIATANRVVLRVFGISLSGGSLDRAEVERILRAQIETGAVTHGGKVAAALVQGIENLLDVTVTFNGQPTLVRDGRNVIIDRIEYA